MMAVTYNLASCNIKTVKECVNGLEALQYAKLIDFNVDFILLDLEMPIMDGFTACQQIIQAFEAKRNHHEPKISNKSNS